MTHKLLEIKNVSKRFGGIKALDNCSLDIEKGTLTAIIGPNGSGKSTLFNVISRLVKEDRGEILLNGNRLSKKEDYQVAKQGVARTFQDVRLFKNLTIKEHLEIAMEREDESVILSLFTRGENNDKKIKEILDLVGLKKDWNTLATDLSYGQRKLLDLAVAIAKPHEILMLDEPVAGINPQLRREIAQILKKLDKQGETILLIEHDMNFVMGVAEYIYVLDEGKVIAHGKPLAIQSNKKVLEAYLGE